MFYKKHKLTKLVDQVCGCVCVCVRACVRACVCVVLAEVCFNSFIFNSEYLIWYAQVMNCVVKEIIQIIF